MTGPRGGTPDTARRGASAVSRGRAWLRRTASHGAWPGVGVAILIALWLVAGALAPGVPPGDDSMAHVLRVRFVLEELAPAWRIDGWQTDTALGHRAFLFYGPGYAWTAAGIHWLSLGTLPPLEAVKVLAVASFVALPLAAAFVARSFGLDARASGIAAVLSLCVASCCGGAGIPALFGIGLLPHALGALPALAALGAAMRLAASPGLGKCIGLALALCAATLTHPISAIVLAALWLLVLPALLVTDRPTLRGAGLLLGAVALAASLSGVWLLPAVAHRDLQGLLTGWPVDRLGDRLRDLAAGRSFLHGTATPWLAAAGALYCASWIREGRRWAAALVLAPAAYLLSAEALRVWNPNHILTMQIGARGLGAVGVIAMLPAAVLLARGADRLGAAGAPLALAVAAAAALASAAPFRPLARPDVPTPELHDLAREIALRVPPHARFATQTDPMQRPVTGVRWPAGWLAWASHRAILDFFNSESAQAEPELIGATDALTRAPPEEMADLLIRLGVTHVALVRPDAARGLLASDRFHAVWRSPGLGLLEVVPRPGGPDPASLLFLEAPGTARLRAAAAERLEMHVVASASTTATVAMGWSPSWRAAIGGRPAPTWRSPEGLLCVHVPEGAHDLVLAYERDRWDALGAAASLAGLVVLGVLVWSRATVSGVAGHGPPAER